MSDDQGNTQQESGSGLRAQLEQRIENERALSDENQSLKDQLRDYRFKDAGLDPTTGMGKAIAKTYSGDDLSPEAILEFAKNEYGYEPGSSPKPQASQQVDEVQQAREQGQSRLDDVDASRLPTDEPDIRTKIAEAMAAGDWETSRALKHQLLDEHNRASRKANAII